MPKSGGEMRIGVDFDNTIVDYDNVFVSAARTAKFIDENWIGGKEAVRRAVRELADGEQKWMRLQGKVYGALMSQAHVVEGFGNFLEASRRASVSVYIVSHKTEHGHFDEERIDLREAARRWLRSHGFSGPNGLPDPHVFFERSRSEKIERIRQLRCSHFIDDLEEVFREPQFPEMVDRYLLSRREGNLPIGPFKACRNWGEICNAIFP